MKLAESKFRTWRRVVLLGSAMIVCIAGVTHAFAEDEAEMFADVVTAIVTPAVPAPAIPDAQMQQFRAQFEPMLKVELSFINRVCKPSDAERQSLIAKCNTWLDTLIREYAKKGGQPNVEGAWFGGPMANTPNPRELLEEGIKKVVEESLSEDQVKLFNDESSKRKEFEKQTALDNLISKIDGELMLTSEQRVKLTESLGANWQKNWAPQLEYFTFGADMLPSQAPRYRLQ
jgi:hypothetical protein